MINPSNSCMLEMLRPCSKCIKFSVLPFFASKSYTVISSLILKQMALCEAICVNVLSCQATHESEIGNCGNVFYWMPANNFSPFLIIFILTVVFHSCVFCIYNGSCICRWHVKRYICTQSGTHKNSDAPTPCGHWKTVITTSHWINFKDELATQHRKRSSCIALSSLPTSTSRGAGSQ